MLIAASIPTLRPLLRRTGNTMNGKSGSGNKMNTWLSKQSSKSRNNTRDLTSISDEGLVFQLDSVSPPEAAEREGYKSGAYSNTDHITRSQSIDKKVIRKETTTEVVFNDATPLDKKVPGEW